MSMVEAHANIWLRAAVNCRCRRASQVCKGCQNLRVQLFLPPLLGSLHVAHLLVCSFPPLPSPTPGAGSFDRFLNLQIALVIAMQLAMCLFCAIANYIWIQKEGKKHYYLALDVYTEGNWQNAGAQVGPLAAQAFWNAWAEGGRDHAKQAGFLRVVGVPGASSLLLLPTVCLPLLVFPCRLASPSSPSGFYSPTWSLSPCLLRLRLSSSGR